MNSEKNRCASLLSQMSPWDWAFPLESLFFLLRKLITHAPPEKMKPISGNPEDSLYHSPVKFPVFSKTMGNHFKNFIRKKKGFKEKNRERQCLNQALPF